ncbi:hypothetical protein H5T87_04860 [bacterium]|nr:hypothetical protein [bacterium]
MSDKTSVFNEADVRAFYRLLNHKYLTELRFLKRGYFPAYAIVTNEDDFLKKCKVWNGKRNIYAGLRDRREGMRKCANFGDIIGVQLLTLDIDPRRPAEIPSTKEELERALEVGEVIRNWFESQGYIPPIRAMTGNGVCLYFCIPFFEVNDDNRDEITRLIERFEQNCREKFKQILKDKDSTIDSMYDLPRIGKVIGTLSVKGEHSEERPWRLSYFIDPPTRINDEKLLKSLLRGTL